MDGGSNYISSSLSKYREDMGDRPQKMSDFFIIPRSRFIENPF